jgi:hypothetical protein
MRTVFIIGEKIFGGLDGQLTNMLRHIVCVTNKLIRCHVSHRGYGGFIDHKLSHRPHRVIHANVQSCLEFAHLSILQNQRLALASDNFHILEFDVFGIANREARWRGQMNILQNHL